MDLDDVRILSSGGKRRNVRPLEVCHRDDDVAGFEAPIAGRDQKRVAGTRDTINVNAGAYRQLERPRVELES